MAWAITSTDEAELLYEDQLIRITFSPNSFITKSVAEKIVRLVEQMHQNEAHANLVDIRQMSSMNEEAKAVFSKQDKASLKGVAILMNDNKLQYSMVEIYFRFNRPAVPTRVFISLKKATYWLKSLLRTEKDTAELAPASNQNQV